MLTNFKKKQKPLQLLASDKRSVRTQFGALPYRIKDDKLQVLLITSRGTGRWIIPKGWPIDGETPAGAAATEAYEEAGVKGSIADDVLGFYTYAKAHNEERLRCMVTVFGLHVQEQLKSYPEKGQRRRKWVSRKKAAKMVWEPELQRIIKGLKV
jgi:8-oxo-dGTP pyrophosphatase MutT (NUDIX family)